MVACILKRESMIRLSIYLAFHSLRHKPYAQWISREEWDVVFAE